MIFDKPLVKRQRFEISFPEQMGRVTVIRKAVTRLIHHMGCTDDLPDDHKEINIDYEIYREVDAETRHKAIVEVEDFLTKEQSE